MTDLRKSEFEDFSNPRKNLRISEVRKNSEGGVAGVSRGSMILRRVSIKYETAFVKHNWKLFHKCGFRFDRLPSEQDQLFDLSSKIEVSGVRFEVSRFLFGTFRGAPRKSETIFVN